MKVRESMVIERIAIDRVLGDLPQHRAEVELYNLARDEVQLREVIQKYRQRAQHYRGELLKQADYREAVRLMIDEGVSLFEIPDELTAFGLTVTIDEVVEVASGRGRRNFGGVFVRPRDDHSAMEIDSPRQDGTFKTETE